MKNKSILLVDDEKLILDKNAHDLEQWGYAVVTASNGQEGIRKFKENPTDLVITDLKIEDFDGIQLSRVVKKINPSTQIIIHTGCPSTDSAIQAVKLGVSDYLLKSCERQEFLESVRKCLGPKHIEHPIQSECSVSRQLLEESGLTAREMEICFLIKRGLTNSEIADELFISWNTVKNHIKKIHKKLAVNSRGQLVCLLNQ